MDNSPYFSVIVPCYNQAHFLEECVSSVLKQEFKDWELIIVDDGSTDHTQLIATKFQKCDGRVKVFEKTNGGLSSARNLGLTVTQGKYIQFLDADDKIFPDCLQEVYLLTARLPETDIVRVGYSYGNESGNAILHEVFPKDLADPIGYVLRSNLGPCHSILIRRELANVIGNFDESLRSVEDWDFWIRAVKAGARMECIPKPLVCYRYVRNSMSRDAFRMYEAFKTVTLRAPLKDLRLKIDSAMNVDHNVDVTGTIRVHLCTCLGISVMQGKIAESVSLFSRERSAFGLSFKPSDFGVMYSYLTFRYWKRPEDLNYILTTLYPYFRLFFEQIGLSKRQQKSALKSVFALVMRIKNRQRFGRLLGGLINRFI